MKKTTSILGMFLGGVLAASILIAAGCGGGGGGGGTMPGPGPQPSPTPTMPTVHINFFGSANGVRSDPTFGNVTGFTQQAHAQVLGLPPGTQVVITNNDTVSHTFNVFSAYPTPGPQSTAAAPNGGVLGVGYQSGVLAAGQSTSTLTVTSTTGNLFIICGIHFSMGMQDGAIVQVGATPGPQATPAPLPSGGMCHGYGC
jgi:plastocyanin